MLIHPYEIYTTTQTAKALHTSTRQIRALIKSGELKAKRIGKRYKILGTELLKYLKLENNNLNFFIGRVSIIEDAISTQSRRALSKAKDDKAKLKLIDESLNLLFESIEPHESDTESEEIVKFIGTRALNSGLMAYRAMLSGYYQVSFMLQRDLLEIHFLFDFFRSNKDYILQWKNLDNDDSAFNKIFKAFEIRVALDKRDGFKEKKRASRYKMFSNYATHPRYKGFTLLTDDNHIVNPGPFFNDKKLKDTCSELAHNVGILFPYFSTNIRFHSLYSLEKWLAHLELIDHTLGFNNSMLPAIKELKKHVDEARENLDNT